MFAFMIADDKERVKRKLKGKRIKYILWDREKKRLPYGRKVPRGRRAGGLDGKVFYGGRNGTGKTRFLKRKGKDTFLQNVRKKENNYR